MNKLKILFLTAAPKEKMLQQVLNSNVEVTAVFVPKSKKWEPNFKSFVAFAKSKDIKVVVAPNKKLENATVDLEFNVLFSCGYPFFIPNSVLQKAKYPINFHPSLLPRHRGRYVHWVLTEQDTHSGVTAHIIDDGYDTGPIIEQAKFKVSPFDTVESLLRKSSEIEVGLMENILRKLINGNIESTPQDERLATEHFEKRVPSDSKIDASKPLDELFFEIRSGNPDLYPAYFEVEGEKVGIKLFRLDKDASEEDMI